MYQAKEEDVKFITGIYNWLLVGDKHSAEDLFDQWVEETEDDIALTEQKVDALNQIKDSIASMQKFHRGGLV